MPRWLRPVKYAVAAAACVAFGLLVRPLIDAGGQTTVATDKAGSTADVRAVAVYEVTLRDPAGRVVGVQRFDSADKAREFAADLSRWQSRNERLAGGQFVVTADRF